MKYDIKFAEKGICRIFGRDKRANRKMLKELNLQPDDTVLDLGCNMGELIELIRPRCKEVIGIDINRDAIKKSNVDGLIVMDARKMDFPDAYFTKIVSANTIEHIPNLLKVFPEIDRVLQPGGRVVLYYPWELFKGMGIMRNAWIFYRNPFKGYKLHVNKLNHKKIAKLIKGTNLKIYKKKFFFDPQPGYITILKKV